MICKFKFKGKNLLEDPLYAIVSHKYDGRDLLGKVKAYYISNVSGEVILKVNYFNGEPWPIEPYAKSVDVLAPDWDYD